MDKGNDPPFTKLEHIVFGFRIIQAALELACTNHRKALEPLLYGRISIEILALEPRSINHALALEPMHEFTIVDVRLALEPSYRNSPMALQPLLHVCLKNYFRMLPLTSGARARLHKPS